MPTIHDYPGMGAVHGWAPALTLATPVQVFERAMLIKWDLTAQEEDTAL